MFGEIARVFCRVTARDDVIGVLAQVYWAPSEWTYAGPGVGNKVQSTTSVRVSLKRGPPFLWSVVYCSDFCSAVPHAAMKFNTYPRSGDANTTNRIILYIMVLPVRPCVRKLT